MLTTTEVPSRAGAQVTGADFDEFVSARGQALIRLAYVLTGNPQDAEDVVQDALARALPRWDTIRETDDPDAYVRRMVVNANISGWRRFRRRETPVATVRPSGAAPDTSDLAATAATRDALWSSVLALPRNQRTAVVLRFHEGLSYAEIAAVTGVRETTARSHVFRGLAALRTTMDAGDPR